MVEGANLPTSFEADQILRANDVAVVPDVLATAYLIALERIFEAINLRTPIDGNYCVRQA